MHTKPTTHSTSGVDFKSSSVGLIIPAKSYHVLRLTGTATEPGALTVRGVFVQGLNCERKEFLLPASTEKEEEARDRRRSMRESETHRMKWTGLDRNRKRASVLPAPTATRPPSVPGGSSLAPAASSGLGNLSSAATSTTSLVDGARTKREKVFKFLDCKVVPEQPLLRVRRTSLTHGAVMLYDGES